MLDVHRPTGMGQVEWSARLDLAAAYRLAAFYGWDDLIYTHISCRLPGRDDAFLINPFGYAFSEITASNLVVIDFSGRVLDGSGQQVNPSGFAIHSAVHRARADAHCVIHLHNPAAVSVSALQCGLLPLSQHAFRFWNDISYHDYQGLALDDSEQTLIVKELGLHCAMLLRNHGSLVCGQTVAEAFVLMHTLDTACRIQLQIMAAGSEIIIPGRPVLDRAHIQLKSGAMPEGVLEWPALLRRVWRQAPDFAT